MIIIASKPGFLGNMIIIHSSFLAFGWKNNIKIYNPAFHDYNSYFEGSEKNSQSIVPYKVSFFAARSLDRSKIKNKLISSRCIDWEVQVDLDDPKEAAKMRSGICLVQGWKFRANKAMAQYRKEILQYFRPLPAYRKQIDEFLSSHFNAGVLNIGIHIRRGDYKNFKDGQYFYDHNEYQQIMLKIMKLFSGRQVQFMITSNESAEKEFFKDLPVIFAPQHELLDMYLLTHCDFIAGPPSTYTMWASYYGEVPLCMIRKRTEEIRLEDFKVQTYF